MNEDTELVDFTRTLKTITKNDIYLIHVLSKMAMKARDNQALSKEISKLVINNIFEVEAPLKLPSFYVVDSITKNVGSPYKEMFAEEIIDAFVHTFQTNKDSKIRIKLYNLRKTWQEYFPFDLMNNLDKAVKKFDPAWPLLGNFKPKHKTSDKKSQSHEVSNSIKSLLDSEALSIHPDPVIYRIESLKEVDYCEKINEDALFAVDKRTKEHIYKLHVKREPSVNCGSTIFEIKSTKEVDNKDELLMTDKVEKEEVNDIIVNEEPCDISEPKTSQIRSKEKVIADITSDTNELLAVDIKDEIENKKPRFENIKSDENKKLPIINFFGQRDFDLRINEEKKQTEEERLEKEVPEFSVDLPTRRVAQPQEPIWRNRIDGFPQMPQIGIDPRFLSYCPYHDQVRRIKIDGMTYDLHLDRIQPCIFVNNELRAVKFYCPMIKISIDDTMLIISSSKFSNIQINRHLYIVVLGGPAHELIINGWPYNVPTDGNVHKITVNGFPVNVQFHIQKQLEVIIQNAIPPFICRWAVKGFFGAPQCLSRPPLNPLNNRELSDLHSFQFRKELFASTSLTNFIK